MARVNMATVRVQVAKDESGRMRDAAKQRATQVFEEAIFTMQDDFESHPVTAEIEGGITSENISNTLGGSQYAPKNLYSFIGFPAGDNPTAEIREALSVNDPAGPRLRYLRKETRDNNAVYRFEISAPNKQAIYKRTPMPWASGMSWAQKIETKVPGFAHFLARFMGEPSRSGGGIQAKDRSGKLITLREDEYQAPAGGYLTGIFSRFLGTVRGYAKGGLRRRFR